MHHRSRCQGFSSFSRQPPSYGFPGNHRWIDEAHQPGVARAIELLVAPALIPALE
jgi:hypothetical protein